MKSMSEIAQPSFLKLRDSTKSILFASNQECLDLIKQEYQSCKKWILPIYILSKIMLIKKKLSYRITRLEILQ